MFFLTIGFSIYQEEQMSIAGKKKMDRFGVFLVGMDWVSASTGYPALMYIYMARYQIPINQDIRLF